MEFAVSASPSSTSSTGSVCDQRASAAGEGRRRAVPDLLIMTATPIPRTLSMTLYGDLDVSVLDELPPGRKPVKTRAVVPTDPEPRLVYGLVRSAVAPGGRRSLCARWSRTATKIEAKPRRSEFRAPQRVRLPRVFAFGLIHGQLRHARRTRSCTRFRRGELDVLVATTVIEVGIDIPNATVMVIEDADRFGLSQLHQLRAGSAVASDARRVHSCRPNPRRPTGSAGSRRWWQTNDGFGSPRRTAHPRPGDRVRGSASRA